MPRKRNPKRDQAYRLWIESDKQKKLKDIATELDASPSTVRKWKSEDNWDGGTKRSALIKKERYDSMKGNKNAKGNSGGKAPPGNKNAVTHGLFAKWLPQETQDIMETLQDRTEADMLWDSIMFQYTAILRSQKIMFVEDIHDTTKEQIQVGYGESGADKFEFQHAWDKQASFLSAQSRALSTLSNLIKQFILLVDEQDERAQKLKLIKANVKLLDLKAKEQTGEDETEDDGFMQALEHEAGDVWQE